MKKLILAFAFVTFSFIAFSQVKKFEIVCKVTRGNVAYAGVYKIIPDSLQSSFIPIKKKSRLTDLAIVNALSIKGWTLVTASEYMEGGSTDIYYILKKEFLVTEQDYQVILNKLKEWME